MLLLFLLLWLLLILLLLLLLLVLLLNLLQTTHKKLNFRVQGFAGTVIARRCRDRR